MPIHLGRFGRGPLLPCPVGVVVLCCMVFGDADAQSTAAAPSPARRHSLGLEAQSVANGGASQVTGNISGLPLTDATSLLSGSDRRVASNQTNLKISVRNYGTVTDTMRAEWFFVALPANTAAAGNREFIFHRDAQALAIPGGKNAEQVVSSPEVQAVYERGTTITTAPAGYAFYGGYTSAISTVNTQKGLTICGWMVRLVADDGSVIAAKGSSQKYEEIALNPARLAGMLARSRPAAR